MERIKLNSTIIGLGLFSTYHGYGDTEWTLREDEVLGFIKIYMVEIKNI